MFTKNIFNQKDGIADLVGNILESDYKNKMEELKGNQHKIDKNKNGKIDSHDFKILRGEKTMQKEAAATPHYTDDSGNQYHYGASGYVSVKNKSGIDQGQRHLNDMSAVHKKNYEKVHGMAWNQKNEEVELEEGSKHAARPRSASRPGTEPAKKGSLQDRIMAARQRMDAKKKDMKEEVEDVAEGTSNKNPPESGVYKVHYGRKNSGGYAYYHEPSTRWLMASSTPELATATAQKHLKAANNRTDAGAYISNYQGNQVAWTKVQGVAEGKMLDRLARKFVPGSARRQITNKIKDQHATYLIAKDAGDEGDAELNKKDMQQSKRNIARYNKFAKEKGVHEDVEQIDELNKDTVYSYNKKSISATGKLDKQLGSQIRSGNAPDANKTAHKLNKRLAGQERADARLNKEETEEIFESKRLISKHGGENDTHTAKVYKDTEYNEYQVHFFKHGKHMGEGPVSYHDDKSDAQGTAEHELKRLNVRKEEVEQVDEEQLDELKKSTVKSYANKKSAELNDVPSYPFKKKTMTTQQHANAYKGLMGAMQRISGKKPTSEETEQIDERTLTKGETAEKERIVKGMKKSLSGFKARYGDKAKSVMYATATKAAKKD